MSIIWIDLENTPHVPFFAPIIRRLTADGFEVMLTARDFAQTVDLLAHHGFPSTIVGGESGKSTLRKGIGLLARAIALRRVLKDKPIALAVGHGSRGLVVAARLLRIPSLTMYDYEGASVRLFNSLSTLVLTPEAVAKRLLATQSINHVKLLTFPGMKEDVYVSEFLPDQALPKKLGLDPNKIIVAIRPPSETAHYRSDASQTLFDSIVKLLLSREDVQSVIVARTKEQRKGLQTRFGNRPNVIIPHEAFDGLSLIYYSDLVIGGGGTMNREAAALGVPVATIFKGAMGAIDEALIRSGVMTEISHAEEITRLLKKRTQTGVPTRGMQALDSVVATIERLAQN